jgi:nucleotide-binding universal stress UspA family protein
VTTKPVVVGTDGSAESMLAVEWAAREAELRGAPLHAPSSWSVRKPWQSPRALLQDMPGELRDAATSELEELLRTWKAKYPDVDTSQDIVHGHPGRILAGLSARADLVVLGRHAPHSPHGPAGVIHAVLGHAHGPVVTVPA